MKTSDFDHRVHTVKHRGVLDTPDRTGRIDAQTRALYERQQIEKHDEAEGRKVLALYNAVIRALDEHDQNWRKHRDIDKGEGIDVAAGRTIRYMSEAIAMLKKDKLDRGASFAAISEARAQYQRPPKAITYFALPDHDRPVEQFEWSVAGQKDKDYSVIARLTITFLGLAILWIALVIFVDYVVRAVVP